MKKILKYIMSVMAFFIVSMLSVSCTQDDDLDSPYTGPDSTPTQSEYETTILIYAIATNSLSGNLISDKSEIVKAGEMLDLKHNNVLVFQTVYEYDESSHKTGRAEVTLLKLSEVSHGVYDWETVADFSDGVPSLNPERVSEVIDYVTDRFESKKYGLIFWSHSLGSQPFLKEREVAPANSLTMEYSFGQDLTNSGKKYEEINVDELADAIPDHLFNFIWFDSCYMSNIESIYEFRDKCDYFIGYATEVLDDGMPYTRVMPLLATPEPDIIEGAKRFFDYYENEYFYHIATIAVADMSKIDLFAEYCRELYQGSGMPSTSGLMKYTRYSAGPFYDLGDYSKAMAKLSGMEISDNDWNNVLDQFVVYKAATDRDFSGSTIYRERYSGISTHIYKFPADSDTERFYQSLDWFNAVFQ